MLRCAGYFRNLSCPFDARRCRRPHCQYRHEAGRRLELPVPQPQLLIGSSGLGLGKNIQELEKIKKAIQSVKTEVEEEQKELLCYNLVHDNLKNYLTPTNNSIRGNKSFFDEDGACNSPVKVKNHPISISEKSSRSSKYILDHSCPATDLEYDPLLNYSVVLKSSWKEEDENDTQHSKNVKMSPCRNFQGSIKHSPSENRCRSPWKRSRSSSPIKLEIKLQESDDDMLIIDAPLVNVSKKRRISKTCKKWNREENEVSFGTNVETVRKSETEFLNSLEGKRSEDITVGLHNVNQSDRNKTKFPKIGSSYLPVSALNVGSKVHTKHCPVTKENNISSQIKYKMNKEILKKDSVNVIAIKTCNVTEQVNNHITLQKNKTQTSICYRGSTKDGDTVLQETSKNIPEHLGKWSMQVHEENKSFTNTQNSPGLNEKIFLKNCGENCNKTVQTDTKENEIIVLDSSEEDDGEEDTELSASDDTMEECRRIFNEFVDREAQKEELSKQEPALAVQTDVESNVKTSVLPRQKRRIAHTAKFDVHTTKEIIAPFKAPLPQQTCNSRILQVQQQAVQITAAVKSGQAFVAATCGSKKTTSVIPATQIQSMGPMVCLNVFEVQPVGTSSGQMNVQLPGNALTAVPYKLSNNPLKKMATITNKVSSRRRPSVIPELGSKVPHDIRQRYVNFFVQQFLKVCATVNEAFDKALIEEKAIYDRCGSKNMYLNIAVNTLKKLRDYGSISSHGYPSGNRRTTLTGFKKQEDKNDFTGIALYRLLKDYALTEEQMKENGFPETNPEKPGSAVLRSATVKAAVSDFSSRVCCRCGQIYTVTSSGRHVRKEECNYHSGKVLRHKVPGGLETRYSCCEGVVGSPGCQVAKLHVHDGRKENMDGFVKTFIKPPPLDGNHGVFALDCEMCYTTCGLELSRVTVVDPSLHVIYNTFVKPDNEIIDYNSRLSGVTAEDMKSTATSIRDAQAILLNLFSADTILIGHSLESDLLALKMFHNKIVDTSVVFPHRLGLPHKRALRNLMADYLQRIIQDDGGGHDCSEDAIACMELMLWKVKEDTKGRRY